MPLAYGTILLAPSLELPVVSQVIAASEEALPCLLPEAGYVDSSGHTDDRGSPHD